MLVAHIETSRECSKNKQSRLEIHIVCRILICMAMQIPLFLQVQSIALSNMNLVHLIPCEGSF
eukprot:SAG31_NODE_927_length_10930_cov_15.134983_2_plen_63_part_00